MWFDRKKKQLKLRQQGGGGKYMVYIKIRSPAKFYLEAAISNYRIQGETVWHNALELDSNPSSTT